MTITLTVMATAFSCAADAAATKPTIDLWKAATEGNLEAIKQHISAGVDLNAK